MNELRRHGRDLIDEARRERTPDAVARERVFGALMASAALTSAASAAAAPAPAKPLTGFSKWLVLTGLAGTMAVSLYWAGHVGVKPQPVPSATSAAALQAELSGLHAAHAAYRVGNATRALALLTEHKARFPTSQQATERATLEVLSLCLAGRTREARGLAERLRKSASGGALAGLDGSCAGQ